MCCTEFLCRTKKPREAAHGRRIERTSFLFSWNRGISWQSWDSSMPPTDPKRVFSLTPFSWREKSSSHTTRNKLKELYHVFHDVLWITMSGIHNARYFFVSFVMTYNVRLRSLNLSCEVIIHVIIINNWLIINKMQGFWFFGIFKYKIFLICFVLKRFVIGDKNYISWDLDFFKNNNNLHGLICFNNYISIFYLYFFCKNWMLNDCISNYIIVVHFIV